MGVWGVVQQWTEEINESRKFVRHLIGLPAWLESQRILHQKVKDYFRYQAFIQEGRGAEAKIPAPDIDWFSAW